MAMALQTQLLLTNALHGFALPAFIFFGTLFLYALHRIVGLEKVKEFQDHGRFLVISSYKNHIVIYAGISVVAALFFFLKLQRTTQLAILLPAIISLFYVLPVFKNKKRLRDLSYVKIFLIALVWPAITVVLPALELPHSPFYFLALMGVEKFFFLLAITLPFDIRDLEIDRYNNVRTIPTRIGVDASIRLAQCFLFLSLLCALLSFYLGWYSFNTLIGLLIALSITALLIQFSRTAKHDYYFTGFLDGTMALQFAVVYLIYYTTGL